MPEDPKKRRNKEDRYENEEQPVLPTKVEQMFKPFTTGEAPCSAISPEIPLQPYLLPFRSHRSSNRQVAEYHGFSGFM
jgi:hypothetical protein